MSKYKTGIAAALLTSIAFSFQAYAQNITGRTDVCLLMLQDASTSFNGAVDSGKPVRMVAQQDPAHDFARVYTGMAVALRSHDVRDAFHKAGRVAVALYEFSSGPPYGKLETRLTWRVINYGQGLDQLADEIDNLGRIINGSTYGGFAFRQLPAEMSKCPGADTSTQRTIDFVGDDPFSDTTPNFRPNKQGKTHDVAGMALPDARIEDDALRLIRDDFIKLGIRINVLAVDTQGSRPGGRKALPVEVLVRYFQDNLMTPDGRVFNVTSRQQAFAADGAAVFAAPPINPFILAFRRKFVDDVSMNGTIGTLHP